MVLQKWNIFCHEFIGGLPIWVYIFAAPPPIQLDGTTSCWILHPSMKYPWTCRANRTEPSWRILDPPTLQWLYIYMCMYVRMYVTVCNCVCNCMYSNLYVYYVTVCNCMWLYGTVWNCMQLYVTVCKCMWLYVLYQNVYNMLKCVVLFPALFRWFFPTFPHLTHFGSRQKGHAPAAGGPTSLAAWSFKKKTHKQIILPWLVHRPILVKQCHKPTIWIYGLHP